MERDYRKISIGEGAFRHRVVLRDNVETQPQTQAADRRRASLLREFTDQSSLWACGPINYDKMTMRHDGQRWIIELESEEGRTR